jgi:SHS2 domain-containing protein
MMDLAGVQTGEDAGQTRTVELQAIDSETLLVDWLHELVVALEVEQMAFGEIDLEIINGRRLVGTVRAVPIAIIEKPVKAVTFNELVVQKSAQGFEATIVFDV